MTVEQLYLFEMPRNEVEKLSDELKGLTTKVSTLRKGVFKRHSELGKELSNLKGEIDIFGMKLYTLESYMKMNFDKVYNLLNEKEA